MTPFWLWVAIGCQLSALLGFSAVRFGVPGVRAVADRRGEHARTQPDAAVLAESATLVREPTARPLRAHSGTSTPRQPIATPARVRRNPAAAPAAAPAPTTAQPEADKLALWARQVRAGERTFALATDGCRVTWDRRCKHGHPSWLMQLGLVAPRQVPPRHRPL